MSIIVAPAPPIRVISKTAVIATIHRSYKVSVADEIGFAQNQGAATPRPEGDFPSPETLPLQVRSSTRGRGRLFQPKLEVCRKSSRPLHAPVWESRRRRSSQPPKVFLGRVKPLRGVGFYGYFFSLRFGALVCQVVLLKKVDGLRGGGTKYCLILKKRTNGTEPHGRPPARRQATQLPSQSLSLTFEEGDILRRKRDEKSLGGVAGGG